jgi:lysophospholipase L1-like esterase
MKAKPVADRPAIAVALEVEGNRSRSVLKKIHGFPNASALAIKGTSMKIKPNSKLVMIGDSVTDVARAQPIGEGLFEAHGKGYVNLVNSLLWAAYPGYRLRVVNMGCSGNTVRSLKARWQTDVVDLKPDWLSIMIGVNDVWRQFDLPHQPEEHVGLKEYESTLDELVQKTLPLVEGLVLMTPYMIEPNPREPMRARMDQYGAVVKKLAKRHGTFLVDTQAAFNAVLRHMHPMTLAWDRIHPNSSGHMVLARAFLQSIDFKG